MNFHFLGREANKTTFFRISQNEEWKENITCNSRFQSNYILWFEPTNLIILKTQLNAVNCVLKKRVWQLIFKEWLRTE